MSRRFQNPALSVKSEVGTPRFLFLCKVGHIGVCVLLVVCFYIASGLGVSEKPFNLFVGILDLGTENHSVKT